MVIANPISINRNQSPIGKYSVSFHVQLFILNLKLKRNNLILHKIYLIRKKVSESFLQTQNIKVKIPYK